MFKIGAHVSSAGDISQTPERAHEIGCECFQFFSRPPQGGPAKSISGEQAVKFKSFCVQSKLDAYIHTPYYINLASINPKIYHGSIKVIREELERGDQLGCMAVMTHLGSMKDTGTEAGLKKVVAGLAEIMNGYNGQTRLLIENSAGAGSIIGDSFEEIKLIIEAEELGKYPIGVCFDTCHAFSSGYDLRDKKAVEETFKKFDETIVLKKLKLIHANDSMTELGSHKDRHEHIGDGFIGQEGFQAIVDFAKKNSVNMILETPKDGKDLDDIKVLKKLRN